MVPYSALFAPSVIDVVFFSFSRRRKAGCKSSQKSAYFAFHCIVGPLHPVASLLVAPPFAFLVIGLVLPWAEGPKSPEECQKNVWKFFRLG